ncbi:hypothetical protein ACVXG7_30740 [Enterobacter hormaechei]
MEKLGCRKSVVGLVILRATLLTGRTSIYLTMAAVFIAQATNSHMDIFHQIAAGGASLLQKGRRA